MRHIVQPIRKICTLALAALTLAAVVSTPPQAIAAGRDDDQGREDHADRNSYAIGLWGGLPYSPEQAAALQNMIADMNSQDLASSAHDGDLKSGSACPKIWRPMLQRM